MMLLQKYWAGVRGRLVGVWRNVLQNLWILYVCGFGKVFATFSLLNCNKISLKPAFIFDKFILVFTVWYEWSIQVRTYESLLLSQLLWILKQTLINGFSKTTIRTMCECTLECKKANIHTINTSVRERERERERKRESVVYPIFHLKNLFILTYFH